MSDFNLLLLAIVGLTILLVATLLLLIIYSGLLADVHVKTGSPYFRKVTLAYKFAVGPFKDCGSYFAESTSISPERMQVGLFYDDPTVVPQEKLRWAVGTVISDERGEIDPEIRAAYEKEKFKFVDLPEAKTSVNSMFPNTTQISVLLGVWRVYPALNRYVHGRGLSAWPYMEIYDKGYINYMAPLDHQWGFMVPEAKALSAEYTQYPGNVNMDSDEAEPEKTPTEDKEERSAAQADTESDDSFEHVDPQAE